MHSIKLKTMTDQTYLYVHYEFSVRAEILSVFSNRHLPFLAVCITLHYITLLAFSRHFYPKPITNRAIKKRKSKITTSQEDKYVPLWPSSLDKSNASATLNTSTSKTLTTIFKFELYSGCVFSVCVCVCDCFVVMLIPLAACLQWAGLQGGGMVVSNDMAHLCINPWQPYTFACDCLLLSHSTLTGLLAP